MHCHTIDLASTIPHPSNPQVPRVESAKYKDVQQGEKREKVMRKTPIQRWAALLRPGSE